MNNLKHEYRDNRGLLISSDEIKVMLGDIGKTEDEISSFLGEDAMSVNGKAFYFISMMATQAKWYKDGNTSGITFLMAETNVIEG